jgi:primosomal protein N' (replication factor Y)
MKVSILIPNIFNHPFTYQIKSKKLVKGDFVKVPFGPSLVTGVVWDYFEETNKNFKMKSVVEVLDVPRMKSSMIKFVNWFSLYNLVPLGMSLRLVMFNKTAVEKIENKNFDQFKSIGISKKYLLNFEQKKCLEEISNKSINFNVHVIDGVTGSGKTLVYFSRVKELINKGYQALIMLPEIGLTSQFQKIFFNFFNFEPAIWHSDVTKKNKRIIWRGVVENKIKAVVGARSSLFLPFKKLGIIIVDEEHDSSYKQDEGVMYNARDMAISRASFENIPINLITSIPSVETFNNILNKKYSTSILKKRYKNASLPKFEIIDLNLKKIPKRSWIASEIIKKVSAHLEQGDQILFFLNRRGFAPFVICKKCHSKFLCPNCSVNINYHKSKNTLLCHYCGFKSSLNRKCNDNSSCDFIFCGPGVERIAEELKIQFPKKKISIFSSDTLKKKDSKIIISKIENRKIDILVGTQLISKGFHFAKLNCIVVVDADFSSHGYDLRSAEKNIQLYHQLSGRAGRENVKSTIYFQTYTPKDEMFKHIANKNTHIFLNKEIELRKKNKLPPFYRFISFIVNGKRENETEIEALKLKKYLSKYLKQEILGPVNAPIFRINKKFRCRLLLRVPKKNIIQKQLNLCMDKIKLNAGIKLTVDVDPISFN